MTIFRSAGHQIQSFDQPFGLTLRKPVAELRQGKTGSEGEDDERKDDGEAQNRWGRLGSGQLSEYLIRWGGVPRPAILAASQVAMASGYAVLATGMAGTLYVGSIVIGTCYGVRLAVSVPVASELFGLKPLGLMYNMLILNLPLGSFLFSSLAGFLYDREAAKESSTTCLGDHCYRVVFTVMAAVSTVGFILDSVLALRTRGLYRNIQRTKRAQKRERGVAKH